MKKIISAFLILFLLTGCWNYKELNEYSIATGIAIDKCDEGIEVSFLISNTSTGSNNGQSQSDQAEIVVYSGKGESIYEAIKDIALVTPKEIYIGHSSIIMISDEVAKDGIGDILDFFLRYPNIRKDSLVVLSKNSKAKDVLKITTPLTSFPSQNIIENITYTSKLQGTVHSTEFNDLIKTLLGDGGNISLSSVKIEGNVKKGSSQDNLNSSKPDASLKLDTLGIFKNDKLIKWVSKNESRGINIINGNIHEMYIKIKVNDGYVILATEYLKPNIKFKLNKNNPKVDIDIEGKAQIVEVNSNINLNSMKDIKKLENLANKKLIQMSNEGINVAKENKTDLFSFGDKFSKKYPKYFKNIKSSWDDEEFCDLDVNISSNLTITNKGATKSTIKDGKYE